MLSYPIAYAVSESWENVLSFFGMRQLRVLHRDGPEIVIYDRGEFGSFPARGLCPLYGNSRNRLRTSVLRSAITAILFTILTSCGGGSERESHELALRPFPYVVNNCVETDNGWTFNQQLRIRQSDGSEL